MREDFPTTYERQLPQLRKDVEKQYHGLPTSAQDVIVVFDTANTKLAEKLQSTDPTTLPRSA